MTNEQIQQRVKELQVQYQKAQLARQEAHETMLRIEGAITVLQEMLQSEEDD